MKSEERFDRCSNFLRSATVRALTPGIGSVTLPFIPRPYRPGIEQRQQRQKKNLDDEMFHDDGRIV